VPPYQWTLDGAPIDLEVQDVNSSIASLSFAPLSAGTHSIGLQDSAGNEAQRLVPLTVYETPRVVSSALRAACPNQAYTAQLQAADGDASSYSWSTDFGASTAITRTGDTIAMMAQQAGTLSFTATVADHHCQSDPATITLPVDPIGPQQCPTIVPTALPTPCRSRPYPVTTFPIEGGTPPLILEALPPLPDGLSFTAGTLSGTPLASGTLTLQVTDGAQRKVQRTYSMAPRDKCWLAYISSETGSGRLGVFDPILQDPQTFPQFAAPTSSVTDFKFSPNGKFIAYRLSASTGPAQLVLIDASTWTERLLNLQGVPQQYSWSLDSSILAVALQNEQGSFLGGIDVAVGSDAGVPSDAASSVAGLRDLQPIPAIVDSELTWLGDRTVVFHAPAPAHQPSFSRFIDGQFLPVGVVSTAFYEAQLRLQGGPLGFFAIDPDGPYLDFYNAGTGGTPNQYGDAVADPASQYVARARAGQLQLFPTAAATGILETSAPPNQSSGCSTVLAWASQRERIACLSSVPPAAIDGGTSDASSGASVVRIFDLNPSPVVISPADVRGSYDYPADDAFEKRRMFSPSGDWFAFTNGTSLYIANLRDGYPKIAKPIVTYGILAPQSSVGDLAFSPDEQLLLWHQETSLFVVRLEDLSVVALTDGPFGAPGACTEDFVAGPDWCGGVGSSTLAWSSDSRVAATMTSTGVLRTWDFESAAIAHVNACTQGCAPRFAFQP
jgi:WD40 repeat protein